MSWTVLRTYLTGALALTVLVALFLAAQPIDFRNHTGLVASLRKLRTLEVELVAALMDDSITARSVGDPILPRVEALEMALGETLNTEGWAFVCDDPAVLSAVEDYRAALRLERTLVGDLHEARTRLGVELQALDAALESHSLADGRASPEAVQVLGKELAGLLRRQISSDPSMRASAASALDQARVPDTIQDASEREWLTSVVEAARHVVSIEPKLEALSTRLHNAQLRRRSTAIIEACDQWFLVEQGRRDVYRIVLYGYAVVLLVLFFHELRSREALLAHVAQVRDSLEARVRRRTAQLSRKNERLANEIRERREAEEQLVAARGAAESASRTKSEFLANMSHEIRTPMTSILGYAERLGEEDLGEVERREAVETIQRNGQYLLQLINDILDLSKIEAGKLVLEQIPCSPAQIVLDVQSAVEVRAQAKGLGFVIELPPRLPERIVTDPTRLKQVLINLLGNAIKFTHSGSVTLRVECDPAVAPGRSAYLSFTVSDTGIGMDEEQVQRLFHPFTQGDSSTTRRFGGTGLGLSICKTLVECMGGRMQVDSRPGLGSRFEFRVETGPLEEVDWIDGDHVAQLRLGREAESMRAGDVRLRARVLLAEDGEDSQRLLTHFLTKAGAEVECVADGHKAVERALAAQAGGRPFDLVVMDMQMPRLDGYGATARLRAAGYRRPIVALTANAMAHDRQRCLSAGCDDFCSKPVDRRRFLTIVARWTMPPPRGAGKSGAGALTRTQFRTLPESAASSVGDPIRPRAAQAPVRSAGGGLDRARSSAPEAGTAGRGRALPAAALPAGNAAGPPAREWTAPVARLDDEDPELAALVQRFVAELSRDLDGLTQALEAGDLARLAFLAHKLKGSAGSYGFPELTTQASRLERCAKGELAGAHVEIELEQFARLCRGLQSRAS